MLIRPPPQIIRTSVPGGRVAGQGFGFPHTGRQAQPADIGGGGGGYVAKAVHFDGSINGGGPTYLRNDSLIATDSDVGSYSIWFDSGLFIPGNAHGTVFSTLILPDGTTNGISLSLTGARQAGVEFAGNTGVAEVYTQIDPGEYTLPWNHLLVTANTTAGSLVVYINDVLLNPLEYPTVTFETPFVIQSNGITFLFGDDTFGDGPTFSCADAWIAPNVSLSDDGLTIPEATRRLFISASGKPVDPAGFPQAAVLFSGDATSFGTNQGNGGAFVQTGTLTNATTSPSD